MRARRSDPPSAPARARSALANQYRTSDGRWIQLTIVREILKREDEPRDLAQLNEWLQPLGLKATVPLGFNNTYALAMKAERAQTLGLRRISDLARLTLEQQAGLRTAFTQEFSARRDGWPAIAQGYGLQLQPGLTAPRSPA